VSLAWITKRSVTNLLVAKQFVALAKLLHKKREWQNPIMDSNLCSKKIGDPFAIR